MILKAEKFLLKLFLVEEIEPVIESETSLTVIIQQWLVEKLQELWRFTNKTFNLKLFELEDKPVSLASLSKLILFAFIAYLIARLLRGFIRRALLVRFGFDRGTLEAVASVIGYILTGLGFLIVLEISGINLSSLTVIAGVLGIGVGFGFQQLAANFISGITLLFEQPIKVGDLIQIDDLLGIVEKISIRSTAIKLLNGTFVIIPNSDFIQNKIINLSYGKSKCPVEVNIELAYGNDTTLVTEAMLAAARQQHNILSEPPPKVLFQNFASTLKFKLIGWINNPLILNSVISDLNFVIESEFEVRGIKVVSPHQQEVRLKNPQEYISMLQDSTESLAEKSTDSSIYNSTISLSKKIKTPLFGETLKDLLPKISYFKNCTKEQIRQLIEDGYRESFPPNTIICHEGDPGNSFYVILSGMVEIFSEKIDRRIAERKAGEFIGEMALLMGIPRSASIRTLEDTTLFVVDRDNLQKLLSNYPQLAEQISLEISKRRESLENMGILPDKIDSEQTVLNWVRKRLNAIFEL
ncbi:MAG: mechanosensitive ion channel [Rivularia sp. (in: Bacteria)]|nr:mechanosensitive ion channel [Rivularia sp. MS3]